MRPWSDRLDASGAGVEDRGARHGAAARRHHRTDGSQLGRPLGCRATVAARGGTPARGGDRMTGDLIVRAALDARVSTDEQAAKFGLSSQVSELRALADRKGYTVAPAAEFLDDGYSGATIERPALTRLRDAVRAD